MSKNKLLRLTLGLIFVLLTSYLVIDSNAQVTSLKAPKYNPRQDILITPQIKDISEFITLAGSIQADTFSELKFQTSGKLAWVGVRVGDRVKKGQAVASLDKTELTKRFQKEANDYLTERWDFEDVQDAYKDDKEKHLIDTEIQRILDRQQFDLNNAVLDYELANLSVKYATIYSPIDGLVIAIDEPNPGVNITPATAAFTIINPNSIYLDTEIDEEEVTKISLGQVATINLDSFPNSPIDSHITYIAFTPKTGQSSTIYQVKLALALNNADLKYRIGMSGDAEISLQSAPQSLTIPTDALIEEDSKKFVLIKTNGDLEYRQIETGIESDNDIAVLSGISLSDQIVIQK